MNFSSSKQQLSVKLPQNDAEQGGSEAPAELPELPTQAGSFSELQLFSSPCNICPGAATGGSFCEI